MTLGDLSTQKDIDNIGDLIFREENSKENQHKKLCESLHDTYVKKNNDYGDSFGKTFKEWGIPAATIRITDKFNRFVHLAHGYDQWVSDEGIKDTLLDMANYCLMSYIEIDNMLGEPNGKA